MNIIKQLVSQNVVNKRSYGKGNSLKYITIHETANTNKGANAQAHANLQSNLNPRDASWQYQVDDKNIIQSFDDTVMCWASGTGSKSGNIDSIHIEMCVNSDGNYKNTIANTVDLVKYLMKKYSIPPSNVVQHNHWSGKDCPRFLRNGSKGITWNTFKSMITQKEEEIFFRVVTGSYSKKENAERRMKELYERGFESFIDVFKK